MPRPGPRTAYKYSKRFNATAVRLSRLRGVSVSDAADSLYIHPFERRSSSRTHVVDFPQNCGNAWDF